MAATIPRAAVDFLTEEINGISADAQARVLRVLESISWTPDNIAECRELVIQALAAVMPTYTTMAAQASADFYDAERTLALGEPFGATAVSGYDPARTDGAVRALVQRIVDGKPVQSFNDGVLERIDYEMKRAAGNSMLENGRADPKGPRFARVPTGSETCEFCIMLASRGFVYRSEKSAGALDHYHANCDCRIVASFDADTVEGYDPDDLYLKWRDRKAWEEKHQSAEHEPFRRIVGEHSIADDLKATNPHYREGRQWQINCQRCVGAYEMRRRGYDVTARPRPMIDGAPDYSDELPNRLSDNGWPHMFENPELEAVAGTTGNAIRNRISQRLREYGDGARVIVRVRWKGRNSGGHVFIAEQDGEETRYIDPQTGSSDCSSYLDRVRKGETYILRVDDNETTSLIEKAVEDK